MSLTTGIVLVYVLPMIFLLFQSIKLRWAEDCLGSILMFGVSLTPVINFVMTVFMIVLGVIKLMRNYCKN